MFVEVLLYKVNIYISSITSPNKVSLLKPIIDYVFKTSPGSKLSEMARKNRSNCSTIIIHQWKKIQKNTNIKIINKSQEKNA